MVKKSRKKIFWKYLFGVIFLILIIFVLKSFISRASDSITQPSYIPYSNNPVNVNTGLSYDNQSFLDDLSHALIKHPWDNSDSTVKERALGVLARYYPWNDSYISCSSISNDDDCKARKDCSLVIYPPRLACVSKFAGNIISDTACPVAKTEADCREVAPTNMIGFRLCDWVNYKPNNKCIDAKPNF